MSYAVLCVMHRVFSASRSVLDHHQCLTTKFISSITTPEDSYHGSQSESALQSHSTSNLVLLISRFAAGRVDRQVTMSIEASSCHQAYNRNTASGAVQRSGVSVSEI